MNVLELRVNCRKPNEPGFRQTERRDKVVEKRVVFFSYNIYFSTASFIQSEYIVSLIENPFPALFIEHIIKFILIRIFRDETAFIVFYFIFFFCVESTKICIYIPMARCVRVGYINASMKVSA